MSEARQLAESFKSYVIAPAGCGKTHLIAEAVSCHSNGNELILTHTHAGVDALRRKCKQLDATSKTYQINTIAGWALKYASAFPVTSGLDNSMPVGEIWNQVYDAAAQVLGVPAVQEVVKASYSGIYVDEYQDCTVPQHNLILKLAELLPCRILGDPLQGIFDFGANNPVNWHRDIEANFNMLFELRTPWRWQEENPDLGLWLLTIREKILNGDSIDLRNNVPASVEWRCLPSIPGDAHQVCRQACIDVGANRNETVVAIHRQENQCKHLVRSLRYMYSMVECIECQDLFKSAEAIGSSTGRARALVLIDFCKLCMTNIGNNLDSLVRRLRNGREIVAARYRNAEQVVAMLNVISSSSIDAVLSALEMIKKLPNVKLYRKELYQEMCRAIRECSMAEGTDLKDAAWIVRNRTRHIGRRMGTRMIGRTLLVKGLEFDHVVILGLDALDAKNLYVSMTRGVKSLTVLSRYPVLQPRGL